MIEYIDEIKRHLMSDYGFDGEDGPWGEVRLTQHVPDGEYPMTIAGKRDNVKIIGGKISCCNWETA